MRKRVYVSAAITKGCKNWNFYIANAVHDELIQAGWAVFNPMLSMANLGAQNNLEWNDWLENDEAWVAVSDLVVRIPGASLGAERECQFARERGIPVVLTGFFPCLAELFPEEKRSCLPEDMKNLMRFNRAQRRATGLAMSARDAALIFPDVVEGFARVS
jgi:hypothetical protein